MYTITKEFTFDAAHKLLGLPPGHKCSQLHGHTYTVIIELKSKELDIKGFVVDYNDLKRVKDFIDEMFDHKCLNDNYPFDRLNPTAEHIAGYIYRVFEKIYPQLSAVTVKETAKTSARYEE